MGKTKAEVARTAASRTEPDAHPSPPSYRPVLGVVREWTDALVIAFLLAMFIRTFVVELFKIPSGSMTPTLVGTAIGPTGEPEEYAIEWDVNNDGEKDLVIDRLHRRYPRYDVFYRKDGEFVANEERNDLRLPLEARRRARIRNDRIVANKFIYWFRKPRRGEIVVFRVPPKIYHREKPTYIKRFVGLPGDLVEIRPPRVCVNGRPLEEPEVFLRNEYVRWRGFDGAKVPEKHYFVLGDNSKSSADSRDWGAVPESNLRGKAILRYWPLKTFGFLE